MNICTQTDTFEKVFGAEKAIELLAKAGFESIDWSMFYPVDKGILAASDEEIKAYFGRLRKVAEDCGIYIYQTHTPFPCYTAEPARDAVIFEAERRALLASSVLGAHHAVVHPPILRENRYGCLAAENKEVAMDFYGRLIPYLDEYGISIAVENMWNSDQVKKTICPTVCSSPYELNDYVDTLNGMCKNGNRFVVCLDVGHTNLSCRDMNIRDIVNIIGPRLKALHVHDTDGVSDLHTAPGFGNIDWDGFCAGLKDIGYDGDFVFEADNFYKRFDRELTYDAGAMLYKIGRRLCDKNGL
ncbi:MAG: sugar phosphate isomerase/epimerase [Clostridia bacterium]|nr:sugar phosphate isomerase/epimerase [Clostridia bacterium]